jgi:hypothetical protein
LYRVANGFSVKRLVFTRFRCSVGRGCAGSFT